MRTLSFLNIIVTLLLGFLGGCTTVFETRNDLCVGASTASYFLPRRKLSIDVEQFTGTADNRVYFNLKIDDELIPTSKLDEKHCLHFVNSLTSADKVAVERTTRGHITRIFSNADDQSGDIVTGVVDTIIEGIVGIQRSAQLEGAAGGSNVIARYAFDPFIRQDMTEINHALSRFGFCIYLDTASDDFAPAWGPAICGQHSNRPVIHKTKVDQASNETEEPKRTNAIYYRPLISHKLIVLKRADPGSRDRWEFDRIQTIDLPNGTPVIGVQVERSLFVERKTELMFDNGVLVNVNVDKESELNAFLDVPLKIVQSIASIPTATIRVRVSQNNNRAKLINANNALIGQLRQNRALEDSLSENGSQSQTQSTIQQSLDDPAAFAPSQEEVRRARIQTCINSGTVTSPDAEQECTAIVDGKE